MGKPVTTSRISPAPHCTYCRHATYLPARAIHICKAGIALANMDAATCPRFRDSRKASSNSYNLPESGR